MYTIKKKLLVITLKAIHGFVHDNIQRGSDKLYTGNKLSILETRVN